MLKQLSSISSNPYQDPRLFSLYRRAQLVLTRFLQCFVTRIRLDPLSLLKNVPRVEKFIYNDRIEWSNDPWILAWNSIWTEIKKTNTCREILTDVDWNNTFDNGVNFLTLKTRNTVYKVLHYYIRGKKIR